MIVLSFALFLLVGNSPLADTQFWEGYTLKPGFLYRYSYREYLGGRMFVGVFEIVTRKGEGGTLITLRGKYREWKGEETGVFSDPLKLSGYILLRMYHRYWLIPPGKTIFMRGLVGIFSGKRVWLRKRDGADVKRCREAGLEGFIVEVKAGKRDFVKVCLSPRVDLPLYVLRRSDGDDLYIARLTEYRKLK